MDKASFPLRMIAWELTRNCNLNCVHCRARASAGPHDDELASVECRRIIDDIAAFSTPTIILTGGEPLLRQDIYELIDYGSSKGLRLVIAVNGTLVDREKAQKLKKGGIIRVSMSLDGKDRSVHDAFRGVSGSFDAVMGAARMFFDAGLPFQINTTVTRLNVAELGAIYDLVREIRAVAWHIFLLVPVGRGEGLKGEELNAAMYEDVLNWLYDREEENLIEMKVTCAPHYYRVVKEKGGNRKAPGAWRGKVFSSSLIPALPSPAATWSCPAVMCGRRACGRCGKGLTNSPFCGISEITGASAESAATCASAAGAGPGPTS